MIYANGLFGPLQFDDQFLASDPSLQSWAAWAASLQHPFRPLLKGSFVVSHSVGSALGSVALGHHVINLGLHVFVVWLAWLVARRLLAGWLPQPRSSELLATLAVLPLALHPLATEAVTYLSGRSMAFGTAFALLAILTQMPVYGAAPTERRHSLCSVACCVAAVLVREAMFVVPVLVMLVEWSRSHGIDPAFSKQRLKQAVYATRTHASAVFLVLMALWGAGGYRRHMEMSELLVQGRVAEPTMVTAMRYFLERLLGLRPPSIDPAVEPLRMDSIWMIGLAGVALLALWYVWRVRQARPQLLFALVWMLVTLAPMYALPLRADPVSERHFYPALFAVGLAVAAQVESLVRPGGRWRFAVVGLSIAAACVMCAGTLIRNAEYQSEISLWAATSQVSPGKARVHANLGVACARAGQWDCAVRSYDRALELEPGHWRWQHERDRADAVRQSGDPNAEPFL